MISKLLLLLFVWTTMTALGAIVATVPAWLLWNWLVPDLFGLPTLTLVQTFGLTMLLGLLFGDRLSVHSRSQDY